MSSNEEPGINWATPVPGSRSQTHVQTFATKFCHVQTFQTKIRHVQTLATKTWLFQTFTTMMIRRDSYLVYPDSRDQELPFPDFRNRKTKARLSRPRRIRRDRVAQETAWPARPNLAISRLSRPRWRRRDFPDQHGDGATLKKFFRAFSTEVETARLSRPWWIRPIEPNGVMSNRAIFPQAKTVRRYKPSTNASRWLMGW